MDRRHAADTPPPRAHDTGLSHPERHARRERNFGHAPYAIFCRDLQQPGRGRAIPDSDWMMFRSPCSSDIGLVKRELPFGEHPWRSKRTRYRIADPVLRYRYWSSTRTARRSRRATSMSRPDTRSRTSPRAG